MAAGDKMKHKAEGAKGKAKVKAGEATGDDQLRDEGRADQAQAGVKRAGDKVGDAAEDVKDSAKKAFDKDK
ncbi:CsbD family protein [Actinopolymorpha singaporensis]|uniref:CsbD-like n=1 Tax=Actinopolymorpha singaporensis TaxID=117157 RepID=A0A1H1M948_9ACTN|nr:CsbD family protein [Actinopolymorpha singaporensis]SDR83266.1 CsbD-like [Actinopolymorpha singaporensis]